jgi:hypothetical protein
MAHTESSFDTPSLCKFDYSSSDEDLRDSLVTKLRTEKAILKGALKHALAKNDKYSQRAMLATQALKQELRLKKKTDQPSPCEQTEQEEIAKYFQFVVDKMKEFPVYKALYDGRVGHLEAGLRRQLKERSYRPVLLRVLELFADVLLCEGRQAAALKLSHGSGEQLKSTARTSSASSVMVSHQSFEKPKVKADTGSHSVKFEATKLSSGLNETSNLLKTLSTQSDKLDKLNKQIAESITRSRRASITELPSPMPTRRFKSMSDFTGIPVHYRTIDDHRDPTVYSGNRTKNSIDLELGGLLDFSDAVELKSAIEMPSFVKRPAEGKEETLDEYCRVLPTQPLLPRRLSVNFRKSSCEAFSEYQS